MLKILQIECTPREGATGPLCQAGGAKQGTKRLWHPGSGLLPLHWGKGGSGDRLMDG